MRLCCAEKGPLRAPPWTIPDSRGVRGQTGVLVWFVLNKMLGLCLLLLSPHPTPTTPNHTNRKVRPNNPLINGNKKNPYISRLLLARALPKPEIKTLWDSISASLKWGRILAHRAAGGVKRWRDASLQDPRRVGPPSPVGAFLHCLLSSLYHPDPATLFW